MQYLYIKLKSGRYKTYKWDDVDFLITEQSKIFVVRTEKGKGESELLFAAPLENIEYYERTEF